MAPQKKPGEESSSSFISFITDSFIRATYFYPEKKRVKLDHDDQFRKNYPTSYCAVTLVFSEHRRVTPEEIVPFFSDGGFIPAAPHQPYAFAYNGQSPFLQLLGRTRIGQHNCLEEITIEAISMPPAVDLAEKLLLYLRRGLLP